MQNFGSFNETTDFVNIITLGKHKYNVLAVNPSQAQLAAMKAKGINVFVPTEEPKYIGKTSSTFGGPEDTDYFDVVFHLRSTINPDIITMCRYRILRTLESSKDGLKKRVINLYGQTSWLTDQEIQAKVIPTNLAFFLPDSMRPTFRGEESLIKFIRAFLNMPVVSNPTMGADGKMRKSVDVDKRPLYQTMFNKEDFDGLFTGKFDGIQGIVASAPDAAVVLVTGARTVEATEPGKANKVYQAFFTDEPLRSFAMEKDTADSYIVKQIEDAVNNGRYSNVYWGLPNISPREYDSNAAPTATPNNSAFPTNTTGQGIPGGLPGVGSPAPFGAQASNPFGAPANSTPSFSAPNQEVEDDLPF